MPTFPGVRFLCQPASPDPGSERHVGWHSARGRGLKVGKPAVGKGLMWWPPAPQVGICGGGALGLGWRGPGAVGAHSGVCPLVPLPTPAVSSKRRQCLHRLQQRHSGCSTCPRGSRPGSRGAGGGLSGRGHCRVAHDRGRPQGHCRTWSLMRDDRASTSLPYPEAVPAISYSGHALQTV